MYNKRFQSSDLFDFDRFPITVKYEIDQKFGNLCHTEVYLTFLRLSAKFSDLAKKFNIKCHSTSMTSKGRNENLKKYISWDNPVSSRDTKYSIGFFTFFLSYPRVKGDSVYRVWKHTKEALYTKVHVASWQCSTKYLGHLPTLVLTHPCNFLFLLNTVCLVLYKNFTKSLTDNWRQKQISYQFTSIGLYLTPLQIFTVGLHWGTLRNCSCYKLMITVRPAGHLGIYNWLQESKK